MHNTVKKKIMTARKIQISEVFKVIRNKNNLWLRYGFILGIIRRISHRIIETSKRVV